MEPIIRFSRHLMAAVVIVKDYIDQHSLEWKSIDHFTELTATNRKALQKAFKCEYGITISEYQLQKRMQRAAIMLEEGRLSTKQISSRCGYHNANNFSRAFKKVYRQSPSYWRNDGMQPVHFPDIKPD
jgi:two-component system response regulator YesN